MPKEIYDPSLHAAIGEFFKRADELLDPDVFATLFINGEFQKLFGELNFAGIEQIFRELNFNLHFLAVPVDLANQLLDTARAVHTDDAVKIYNDCSNRPLSQLIEESRETKYIAVWFSNKKELEQTVTDLGLYYEPLDNLADLQEAGLMYPVPGTPYAREVQSMQGCN